MANSNKNHLWNEIKRGIKQLIQGNEKDSDLATKIKRKYKMLIEEIAKEGEYVSNTKEITDVLNLILSNYDQLRQYEPINEIMMQLLQQYEKELEGLPEIEQEKGKTKIFGVYSVILGNSGTNSQGMSVEYIEEIIRTKIIRVGGICSDDIINLLEQQSTNPYLDIEEYQRLIRDTILTHVTQLNLGADIAPITNPRVIKILSDLAQSYRFQNRDEDAIKTYEEALKLTSLSGSIEYSELETEYSEFKEVKEILAKKFDTKTLTSFEDIASYQEFLRILSEQNEKKDLTLTQEQRNIFNPPPVENDNPNPRVPSDNPDPIKVMPNEAKFKALQLLIKALKEKGYSVEITEVMVGKDGYNGYCIFPLQGTHISALEQFRQDRNAAFYMMPDSARNQIIALTRTKAKVRPDVEHVDHYNKEENDFERYVNEMIEKAVALMDRIGIKPNNERPTNIPNKVVPAIVGRMIALEKKGAVLRCKEAKLAHEVENNHTQKPKNMNGVIHIPR